MLPVLMPISNQIHTCDQVFERALGGVSEELARQPMDRGNRFLWVAAHVVIPRAWLVRRLGGQADVPWEEAFNRGAEPPTDEAAWPKLADVQAKWRELSSALHARLDTLTEADLAKPIEAYPSTDGTVLGGISLQPFHDTYHLGQLGHLRRRLGLERMVG